MHPYAVNVQKSGQHLGPASSFVRRQRPKVGPASQTAIDEPTGYFWDAIDEHAPGNFYEPTPVSPREQDQSPVVHVPQGATSYSTISRGNPRAPGHDNPPAPPFPQQMNPWATFMAPNPRARRAPHNPGG
jgi:hypothetical protein